MLAFLRTIHVLSVALWFGSVAFFTVAGVLLFGAFEKESLKPQSERPAWFPIPPAYQKEVPPESNFPTRCAASRDRERGAWRSAASSRCTSPCRPGAAAWRC